MSNIYLADLLFNAIVWADFLGGFIVGLCLMALGITFFWPRTDNSLDDVADESQSDVLRPATKS